MKQYIIFDLEATCWESRLEVLNHEIIEIGAVKLDEKLNRLSTFQTFVRPIKNPILSDYCINLTHISQSDVNDAPSFMEAIGLFEEWINRGDETLLLSWGHYDKKQLEAECDEKNYYGQIRSLLLNHRSLKHDFALIMGKKLCGMEKALHIVNLPLLGEHHRAIDDATNIAAIFLNIYDRWRVMYEMSI